MRKSVSQIREGAVKSETLGECEENKAGAGSRMGVFFLRAGGDAPSQADLGAVAEYAAQLPGVVVTRNIEVSSAMDPEKLSVEIRQAKLETVILAAEHPGFYKPAFARALVLAGVDEGQVRLASFAERGQPLSFL